MPSFSVTSDDTLKLTGIAAAKAALAPDHPASAWVADDDGTGKSAATTMDHVTGSSTVTINGHAFVDNAKRFRFTNFQPHGDNLPHEPTVITGCCDDWGAFSSPGQSWSVSDLAKRLDSNTKLNLDGGPYFARMSMNAGRVSMSEYERYCYADTDIDTENEENGNDSAAKDIAPLYLFDPDVLKSNYSDGQPVSDDFSVLPPCFSQDTMAGLTGSRFRPLPPAWLLVGVTRSGTPIHDHPFFVAWNALLVGCKLWCCFPPNVDESVLLLDGEDQVVEGGTTTRTTTHDENENDKEGEDDDFEFDVSALQWFSKCCSDGRRLPDCAKLIVQQPGEVAYVPPGWWHVVVNVETSTAICYTLTLRRDIPQLFPPLLEADEDFCRCWLESLSQNANVAQALYDLAKVYDDTTVGDDDNNGTSSSSSDQKKWTNPEMAATCYARSAALGYTPA
jgi:hypothetical protein